MIGIGGVSMSGIAAILKNWGFHVTGSDRCQSETTNKLNELGIKVTIGHNIDDVNSSDLVVYSAAIKKMKILKCKLLILVVFLQWKGLTF